MVVTVGEEELGSSTHWDRHFAERGASQQALRALQERAAAVVAAEGGAEEGTWGQR